MEFWSARDLQGVLGYSDWRNFGKTVEKAKESCKAASVEPKDHFVESNKMVGIGSGAEREVGDVLLTRYAAYLIAQNTSTITSQFGKCSSNGE